MDYKLINTEYLNSIAGDDPQVISEIVEMFREQTIEIFGNMKVLCSKKDYNMLGMIAHKAKSSVAIMGMNELAAVLNKLELSAKEGKNEELYDSYIKKFGEDTKAAIAELDNMVAIRLKKS